MADKPQRPMRIDIPESKIPRGGVETHEESVSPKSSGPHPTVLNLNTGTTPTSFPDTPLTSSASASSNKQLGHDASDRVFPVRSVVSVDPMATPVNLKAGRRKSSAQEHDGFPGFSRIDAGGSRARHDARVPSASSDNGSIRSKGSRKSQISGRSLPGALKEERRNHMHDGALPEVESPGEPEPEKQKREKSRTERKRTWSGARRPTVDDGVYGAANRIQLFKYANSETSTEKGTDGSTITSTASQSNASQSETDGIRTPLDTENMATHTTARFKHVVTKEGHAIITGRDGDTLQKCEDEPIHIPGAVQSFGLLIALSEETEGVLTVRIVSENSERMIGYTPQELFKLKSFTDILSEEQADNVLDHIDFIRDEEADPASNGPEVFIVTVKTPHRRNTKLWCAMHINPVHPDIVICEFELDDDHLYPLAPPSDEVYEEPESTLGRDPTPQEMKESTHTASRPLRVLRSARKRKGEAAAMEVFNILSQVQEQLSAAKNLVDFLKVLVGVVKELTGFHRVMIYQFDSSWNGRVVTELVDRRATVDLYQGLNFPASDIPKQARDLYKVNRVRLLYDRDLQTSRLVCRTVADLETPLDLSYSYLRAMSPIHIKYLANMAVRSSMSISINAFGELWGLVSCHSYGSKGMRMSFPIRKMCRLIGKHSNRAIL